MDILGVGPLEVLFIILIALLVLNPKDIEKTGRTIGRGLNKIVKSDFWQTMRMTTNNLRTLPNKLMRDANLEDDLKDIQREFQSITPPNRKAFSDQLKAATGLAASEDEDYLAWTTPQSIKPSDPPPVEEPEPTPEE